MARTNTIANHIDHVVRRKDRKKVYCVECDVEFTWWQHRIVSYRGVFVAPAVDPALLAVELEKLNLKNIEIGYVMRDSKNLQYTVCVVYDARGNWAKDASRKTATAFSRLGFEVPEDWSPTYHVTDTQIVDDPQPKGDGFIWA